MDVRSGVPAAVTASWSPPGTAGSSRPPPCCRIRPGPCRRSRESSTPSTTWFAAQPVFASAEDAQGWEDLLWEAFRSHDLADWLPLAQASPDVAFEVARTSEEGLDHPQIIHNGDVAPHSHPAYGPVRQGRPDRAFLRLAVPRIEVAVNFLGVNEGTFAEPMPAGLWRGCASGAPAGRGDDRGIRLQLRHPVRPGHGRGSGRPGHQDRGPVR